ncbi:MAG TPA: hypothetical protein VI729_12550 [Anaerolineales bacterium]|nr:hypothetical protein [Anaerolineales bacterium]
MSALRRTLVWIFLAGAAVTGAALGLGFALQASRVVLVPDTLGGPMWPIARQDSSGMRCIIEWWPARQR